MKHHAADKLSRVLNAEVDNNEMEEKILVLMVTGTKNYDKRNSVEPINTQKKKRPPKI